MRSITPKTTSRPMMKMVSTIHPRILSMRLSLTPWRRVAAAFPARGHWRVADTLRTSGRVQSSSGGLERAAAPNARPVSAFGHGVRRALAGEHEHALAPGEGTDFAEAGLQQLAPQQVCGAADRKHRVVEAGERLDDHHGAARAQHVPDLGEQPRP